MRIIRDNYYYRIIRNVWPLYSLLLYIREGYIKNIRDYKYYMYSYKIIRKI